MYLAVSSGRGWGWGVRVSAITGVGVWVPAGGCSREVCLALLESGDSSRLEKAPVQPEMLALSEARAAGVRVEDQLWNSP